MENKQEGSLESHHSLHSQDTELIEEADSSHNISFDNESTNSSLHVNTGSPHVYSLIEFSPPPNDSNKTACSTPHESKLFVSSKRSHGSTSDEMVVKKKKITSESGGISSKIRSDTEVDSTSSRALETEISQEGLDVSSTTSSTNLKNDLYRFKRPDIGYAEPSSSSSSVLTSCFDFRCKEAYESLSARLIQIQNENTRLKNENRNLRSAIIRQRKREINETPNEHRGKCTSEIVLCDILYYYNENEEEITGMTIRQMNKGDLHSSIRPPRSSLSSGSLADVSSSESTVLRGQSIASGSSSLSSVPSHAGKPMLSNRFLAPPGNIEVKKHINYHYPKSCVCGCYCFSFIDHLTRQSTRCLTPETSCSSSENTKVDLEDFPLAPKKMVLIEDNFKQMESTHELEIQNENPVPDSDNNIIYDPKDDIRREHSSNFRSRSSMYIPASTNLPVFAKWPSNSYCYPGIVENATEDNWHKSSNLEVKFCDGTVKKILSENLFPAYLLPRGTEISFEKDDFCETAILISIERLMNNELVCLGELKDGIGETVNIPFHKIFLSDYCYKELKREMNSTLTPKKTPKFSISSTNVQEGKRIRKTVKRDVPETKLTDSSGRNSKPRAKRTRPITDSSSSETIKGSNKKKYRTSSQKNQPPKNTDGQTSPIVEAASRKDVNRKLYTETPCTSSTVPKKSEADSINETVSTASDTETTIQKAVAIDEVFSPNLDSELVPPVSLRAVKSKSTYKKGSSGSKDLSKGPLPQSDIFSGFNFVLTHAFPKENPFSKSKIRKSLVTSGEEGSETDYEDYFACSIPFDHIRLREQITSGGGRVYRSLLQLIPEELKKTILITDNIVETPNYLLAVSLGIPIYRFDLIINCCIQEKRVSEMLGFEMKLPNGRSLETGRWVDKKFTGKPLNGHTCILSLIAANESTVNFWWHILNNAGATVIQNNSPLRLISGFGAHVSFIVADNSISLEVWERARCIGIPIVSTTWVMQTVIHGKTRVYNGHIQYEITPDPS